MTATNSRLQRLESREDAFQPKTAAAHSVPLFDDLGVQEGGEKARRNAEALVGKRPGGLVTEEQGRINAARKNALEGGPRVTNLFGEADYAQLGFRTADQGGGGRGSSGSQGAAGGGPLRPQRPLRP